jgi:hypothetical protein
MRLQAALQRRKQQRAAEAQQHGEGKRGEEGQEAGAEANGELEACVEEGHDDPGRMASVGAEMTNHRYHITEGLLRVADATAEGVEMALQELQSKIDKAHGDGSIPEIIDKGIGAMAKAVGLGDMAGLVMAAIKTGAKEATSGARFMEKKKAKSLVAKVRGELPGSLILDGPEFKSMMDEILRLTEERNCKPGSNVNEANARVSAVVKSHVPLFDVPASEISDRVRAAVVAEVLPQLHIGPTERESKLLDDYGDATAAQGRHREGNRF